MEEKKPGLITRLLWWVDDKLCSLCYRIGSAQRVDIAIICNIITIIAQIVIIILLTSREIR